MQREIIAILRGITPDQAEEVATVLIDAGISKIEVPLNSPQPFDSIQKILKIAGERAIVGAGTVLTVEDVQQLSSIGGQMVVSPDCNPEVIAATKAIGMLSYPGVMTPSECFAALRAGADGLKLFPASLIGTAGLSAMRAVLPEGTKTYAVGGAGPDNFAQWQQAGAAGFGIGTAIFKPGFSTDEVAKRAQEIVAAYDRAYGA
ncbi:2-dehydro-3-deoxy-6-phosphogalactonate aldolase [Paracoccus seriniphilus]|uniref:2-keto-3-deoxy-phosphogalactonate aldolase n=1 Tax=Paracoccus seriniphilus TaxID=184748 RepID=A0A239PZ12_9RHOB|nr:2-dehydro-3-deoxy-6-phosphogalactonate aldolase [Paracoccus seriniphilus]WCR16003.1 2-dehydro-3-deoxy-6-phosphogalactonate aldolase [Paracoccus seriniphilus]SNT75485.1 2-keto-3-deoxy-phosphogalactonate aldolase [Paracoccus seriniphilus]